MTVRRGHRKGRQHVAERASWFMTGRLDFDWPATREALEALPLGVVVADRRGRIRFANDTAAAFLPVQAVASRQFDTAWFDRLTAQTITRRIGHVRLRRRRRDGRVRHADCHARAIRSAHGEALLLLTFARCLAPTHEAPRREDRILAEHVRDHAILMVDNDGILTSWSPAAQRMLGYTPDEVIGRSIERLHPPADDSDELIRGTLDHARRFGRHEEEGWRVRKDGTRIRLHVVTTALEHPSKRVVGFACIIRDLSERLAVEEALRRSEEQLRHAQKMEAVGRLAGGVAHDFNNLITAIRGHAQFILEDLPPTHASRADADEIKRSADRAATLTRQLLTFSRRQPVQAVVLDVNEVITGMETLSRRLIREDIELSFTLEDGLWPVRADRGQLEQVLMNLLVNARDAIDGTGAIDVATRNVVVEEPYAAASPLARGEECVQITVSDSGCGMDRATLARIFEPFFTTKAEGHGTGLGLATVYGIVRQSGGDVSVESEPGQGTTFRVRLPRVQSRGE
jgi:PAS domain S-box-containing protein